ncbi:alpha/beta fold hydrolase [Myxococcota bacterium]|nr:alpha/beta fold hydrolase [Myxococcota bacterium]
MLRASLQLAERVSRPLTAALAEQLFLRPRRFTRPARERELLALARAERTTVAGHAIATWRWGEGPTILLVHGWEGRGTQLGAFIEPLVERGHSVLAFDAPGHGASGRGLLTLVDLARIVAELSAREPLAGLVAHSFGAAATTLALARFEATARRLVYVAPASKISGAIERFRALLGLSPALADALAHRLERRTGFRPTELDSAQLVHAMPAPLLVVHDLDDREVPFEEGQALAEAWPHARLEPVRALGHRRILWDASVVDAATRFLTPSEAAHAWSPPIQHELRALYLT